MMGDVPKQILELIGTQDGLAHWRQLRKVHAIMVYRLSDGLQALSGLSHAGRGRQRRLHIKLTRSELKKKPIAFSLQGGVILCRHDSVPDTADEGNSSLVNVGDGRK